ncbi:MAG: sulfate permease [Planctomycetes bacterium]|nr:sulfate permease [Planctomycetota bacterium]
MAEPTPAASAPLLAPRPRGLLRWLPGLAVLRIYRRAWLLDDVYAGVVLTAILVPVGMGYAEASGLPAIHGLYATIVPLLVYALCGPSRILVLGPGSSLAAIIAAAIVPLSAGDSSRAVELAGVLALLAGGVSLLLGLLRFGFVTELLSKPVRLGYLHGIALAVLVGQTPKLLGFSVEGERIAAQVLEIGSGVLVGEAHGTALGVGLSSLAVILVCKRMRTRVPGVLLVVIAATLASYVLDLSARTGLPVVGPMPQGLPTFHWPSVRWEDLGALLSGAVAIALLSFADTSVLSRTYAARGGTSVDPDQELVALGFANCAAGVTQGFAVSSSSSRTPVAEAAGARTQLTGVVGALCIALLLLVAPGLLSALPRSALAAVVISAALSLLDFPALLRLARLRRSELFIALVCFTGVAAIGVLEGIFVAIAIALLAFVARAWRPYSAVLARVDGLKGYHDLRRHPEGKRIPGLVLFRWDAPLFFANTAIFHERVSRAIAEAPTPTRWLVVAAQPVTDIDITAADELESLHDELRAAGIQLCFAELKGPVKDRLQHYGLYAKIGERHFFRTVGQSVEGYIHRHEVPWVDWEDRAEGAAPAPSAAP